MLDIEIKADSMNYIIGWGIDDASYTGTLPEVTLTIYGTDYTILSSQKYLSVQVCLNWYF